MQMQIKGFLKIVEAKAWGLLKGFLQNALDNSNNQNICEIEIMVELTNND